MDIQKNVLKHYLRNVYFITGTPCAGKTSVSRELGRRTGYPVYDADARFDIHRGMSDPGLQPDMNRSFSGADEFFSRSVEEYRSWLLGSTRQQMDFLVMDLIREAAEHPVICDCHLTPEEAGELTDPGHIVFLLRYPEDLVEDYCNRPDHQGFSDFIHSASDYEKAKATCNETLFSLNEKRYRDVKNSCHFWLERTPERSVEQTVDLVENHFGLDVSRETSIVKVEKGSALSEQLIRFVENCSWDDVKEHTLMMLRDWGFTDWETMFAAVYHGEIIGMASLLKTDYYPLPEIFPWVSTVFVDEAFRGKRISGKLIDYAHAYALSQGFRRTWIPSSLNGFYERFGYRYVRDIVNYGGGTEHMFVREPCDYLYTYDEKVK